MPFSSMLQCPHPPWLKCFGICPWIRQDSQCARGVGDSQLDSRESIRFARIIRNWHPYFHSASGRFAWITRISDSRESPDSCESIRTNRATKLTMCALLFPYFSDFFIVLSSGSSLKSPQRPLFLMGCFPLHFQEVKRPLRTKSGKRPILEGPTRKPRHARVFSTHSDTQADPAFHCIRMFKGIFSTR